MTNEKSEKSINQDKSTLSRRNVIKALAGIPVLGVFSYELLKKTKYDKQKDVRLIQELGLQDIQQPKALNAPVQGDKLRIGFVGYGNRAAQLASGLGYLHPDATKSMQERGRLDSWLQQDDLNVEVTAVCDVFDLHAEQGLATFNNEVRAGGAKSSGKAVKRYKNYREMLEDKDIDAIVIGTPDHHHARITTDAVKAGKHVYCEKSISVTEDELNMVYNAVKESGMVFQLGHQVTQNVVFQQAKEIVKKNILGKISLIEATVNRNTASGAWIRHVDAKGNLKPGSIDTIDWDEWLGDRPKKPFSIDRFYNWTKFFDYDTGMLGQLFTHEFDAINQLLNIGIPHSAVASGGIYYWKDNREIPDTLHATFEYPNHDLTLLFSATLASSRNRGRVFMGHDAAMELSGSLSITADYDSTQYKEQIESGVIDVNGPMITISPGSGTIDAVTSPTEKYYSSRGLTQTYINNRPVDVTHLHIKDWIDCIRTGNTPSCNIDRAFDEGVAVLMAHKSYVEKRRVEWDPVNRKIV